MGSIILTCKNNLIVTYEEAVDLVVYDMDLRKIIGIVRKPSDPLILEDLAEEYDPWVIVTKGISEENEEILRDIGVKIVITKRNNIMEYINEVMI
ncbi:MAG: hypothetical protein QXE81_06310 [Desulfurococcaceae archaeon]